MLDKINGISNVDVSNSLHFDSFNNTDSPGLNVDISGKSGGNSPPNGKLEEVMPILVKLIEQLVEMLQSDSAEDSASPEGEGEDNVVPTAEESGSAGHSSSGEEESSNGAGMPMEGGAASEKSAAGSSDMSVPESGGESSMSGELGEIMTLLVKLIEQLMQMLQEGSTEASSEEKGGDGAATPAEGGEAPGASETAASSDSSAATGEGEPAMSGDSGEVMQSLAALVEQLMKMLQGDSASAEGSASDEGVASNSAASPMEGGSASDPSSAESGDAPATMGGELGEIMQLLTKLVEQLMAVLQGDSTKDSASAEGAKSGGAAPSTEEGSGSSDHSPATDGEHADKAAAPVESGMAPEASSAESGEAPAAMSGELGEILQLLTQLIEQLMAMLEGDSASGEGSGSGSAAAPSAEDSGSSGHSLPGSSESNNGAVTPAEGGIKPEASSAGSGNIPAPTEHLQSFDLGGKSVTIGGDGSASAAEVQSTAESIQGLYQNSDTFRNMIDSSSDEAFEVSVGKRDDNTSWGNSEGRVFMNINNVEPGNSDTFQSLLGHEFAHASIDIGHGSRMEQLESTIAAEA